MKLIEYLARRLLLAALWTRIYAARWLHRRASNHLDRANQILIRSIDNHEPLLGRYARRYWFHVRWSERCMAVSGWVLRIKRSPT